MNILALEFSTSHASVAVFRDGVVFGEEAWDGTGGRSEDALRRLPALLERADVKVEDIAVYAVGRGPGNYSGMRVGLSMAQAMALPGGAEVFAVSSGAALAAEEAEVCPDVPIGVVGDARRRRFWLGVFAPGKGVPSKVVDWRLVAPDELPSELPEGTRLVSPEWTRLAPVVEGSDLDGLPWVRENRYPSAVGVGRLVLALKQAGLPSEETTPIYLHPAV